MNEGYKTLFNSPNVCCEGASCGNVLRIAWQRYNSLTNLKRSFAVFRNGSGVSMNDKVCPDCAETIKQAARVCKHCGYRFSHSATEDTASVEEAPSIQAPANEGRGPITVKFVRQASWYGIFVKLTLFADDIELGEIGAGEELTVTLPSAAHDVYGEMQTVPMQQLPVERLEDGNIVFIRSTASPFNLFARTLPLEFEIVTPDTFVDVGSKSDKIRAIGKAFAIGIFVMLASIAWVKEGWRLSGYDTEEQMEQEVAQIEQELAQTAAAQERGAELLSQIGLVTQRTPSFGVSVVQRGSSDDLWCDDKDGILYELKYASFNDGYHALDLLEEHGADLGIKTSGGAYKYGRSTDGDGYINGLFVSAWVAHGDGGSVKVCDIGGVLPDTQKAD